MIKLSQIGAYSLHAVIFVASQKEGLIKIRDISEKESISESLLRRIVADLEKAGIIKTVRGRNGGITLAKNPEQISMYDILEAVGEELSMRDCTKGLYCPKKTTCTTTDIFSTLQRGFNSLLKMNTLDKILQK